MNDVRAALPPMVRAFWTFPETVHLLPSERARRRVLPRYLAADMADASRFGGLHLTRDAAGVVGAIAWLPPDAYPVPMVRQIRQLMPLVTTLPWAWRAAVEGQRGSSANRSHHRGYEPHYFVRAIGVDPAQHGRGIGTSLMAKVFERADAERVGCFLFTATESNAAWYTSLGFDTAARYKPTPTWPDVWAMWRPPR
jgi:ribosomal protein S18 acetylase RimI-like enzyme